MPHMIITYAREIEDKTDIKALVKSVWDTAEKSGLFTPSAIKSRALPVDAFVTGGTDKPFVHIDARMFAGRTVEQKQTLVAALFETVTGAVGEGISVSVEAIDMDKACYIKN
nr:5-carboxymethyl-2-hydroxymuconate Delta-isomerase [uncultured Cohaesibacter sp.]